MLIDLLCPVEVHGTVVKTNSETNVPYLLLKLFNKSNKIIDTLTLNVKAYNENGVELATLPVEFTELEAQPQEFFAETKAISLENIPDAQNFIVEILSAVFSDEETYEYSEDNLIDCDTSEASLADALKLRESFEDAVCFAKDHENYWRCACGTPNLPDAEVCSNCASTKELMLSSFTSLEALEEMLAKKKEQEEAEKAAKKQRIKKRIITAIIAILAIAVLAIIGFFAKNLIYSLQAGSAVKGGDYAKAYELYTKAGSSKAVEYESYAMGNTPSNLMYSNGFLAEDDENIYFLTYEMYVANSNLIKENKQTGEKTILTDAAISCLNVVGDYVYFINADSYPCRITKDGNTTEILFEKAISYMCVIGNDLYYLATDYDNAGDLTPEQLQALAAQGQIESHQRLHKYNINSKKELTVSNEDMTGYAIYNGRIYYLTAGTPEDAWSQSNIKSMNLKGEDIQTHVDMPTMTFYVNNNELYYIAPTIAEAKDSGATDFSTMDYTIKKLNITTGETIDITTTDDLVFNFNVFEDKIYYIKYDRAQYIAYASGQTTESEEEPIIPSPSLVSYNLADNTTKIMVTGELSAFNVVSDDIFCVFPYEGMARLKHDASGFEMVYNDGTSTPSEDAQAPELSPDLQDLTEDIEESKTEE